MNQWLARPESTLPRGVVQESWSRARASHLDPEAAEAPIVLEGDDLARAQAEHPLAPALDVIRKLLHRDAETGSGVLVAVGDAMGRLLWVDGDQRLKARAESMLFLPGADWSERSVGTSAPGTALALDHSIQIHAEEHFAAAVQTWSCTASPVHDPETGMLIGVIDITGGQQVIDQHTLPLLEATAAAVERELLVQRLLQRTTPRAARTLAPFVRFLGTETALCSSGHGETPLSARHSEILALLLFHPEGLRSDELAALLYEYDEAPTTVRAEVSRLKRQLRAHGIDILSRPYRLSHEVETDADRLVSLLDRGAHRVALSCYRGEFLPGSLSPGVVSLRGMLAARLRSAMLTDAGVDALYEYATTHARWDREVWMALLARLPQRSPKRAAVVEHIEALDIEIGA
ncbi:GAF domain-containing protein [Humidisolicoccus flavus]|uniref:GAF domain-containing protein n=1 Tax=Humidisolicoccus flavus TaxID=3111414 RepID=UPI0032501D0F